MNTGPKDDLDRVIDETLASMVADQPRRVGAASVRRAMGEGRGSNLPMWLAVAAALIVGVGLVLKERAPIDIDKAPLASRSTPSSSSVEVPNPPSTNPVQVATGAQAPPPRSKALVLADTTDEGLPRLIAAIEVPEPLSTAPLLAEPIQIPGIEIAPISVSTLSTEQEHNQEPPR